MIRQARINPFSLDWRRFLVIEDELAGLVACGQVKPHRDGTRELASIAVTPRFRGQGAGETIIRALLAEHRPPLYLTCRASLQTYYARFGFRALALGEMPAYYRLIARGSRLANRLAPRAFERVRIMILENSAAAAS